MLVHSSSYHLSIYMGEHFSLFCVVEGLCVRTHLAAIIRLAWAGFVRIIELTFRGALLVVSPIANVEERNELLRVDF